MPTYSCPDCKTKVQSATAAQPGQKFQCPECDAIFVPRAEALALKEDDPPPAAAKAKAATANKAKLTPTAAAQPAAPRASMHDDLDNDNSTYAMIQESEEEQRLAEKNKPTIGSIRDRFKKSARGPAAALLVTPSNLLMAQGGLFCIFGLAAVIYGIWPLLFTDVSPSDEEIAEQVAIIFIGIGSLVWGGITVYGAYEMVTLGSRGWAIVGALFGLLPLLAGIFALTTLWDPRVVAGFAEPETGPIQTEADNETKKDDDEDEEDEEEEEDEDEDEEPVKKKRR
jgi:hypothetical protein